MHDHYDAGKLGRRLCLLLPVEVLVSVCIARGLKIAHSTILHYVCTTASAARTGYTAVMSRVVTRYLVARSLVQCSCGPPSVSPPLLLRSVILCGLILASKIWDDLSM